MKKKERTKGRIWIRRLNWPQLRPLMRQRWSWPGRAEKVAVRRRRSLRTRRLLLTHSQREIETVTSTCRFEAGAICWAHVTHEQTHRQADGSCVKEHTDRHTRTSFVRCYTNTHTPYNTIPNRHMQASWSEIDRELEWRDIENKLVLVVTNLPSLLY